MRLCACGRRALIRSPRCARCRVEHWRHMRREWAMVRRIEAKFRALESARRVA